MIKRLIRLFWKSGILARVAGAGLAILLLRLTPVPAGLVESVRRARAAYQSDRYQEASAAYRDAYAYQPWSTELLTDLVRASVLGGDHAGAVRYLEQLAAKRPLGPEEISLLGTALVGQGQVDEAIALWEQARDEGAVEASTLAQLGDIYVSRKQWRQASEVLATVARFAPSDAELLYRLGLIQALDERRVAGLPGLCAGARRGAWTGRDAAGDGRRPGKPDGADAGRADLQAAWQDLRRAGDIRAGLRA
ncbi:MAG: tetratricopeptide repeat protein [Chloroflexota bacterium]